MRKLFVVLAVVGLAGGLLAVTSTTGSATATCPTILVHTPNPPPSPGVDWSGCNLTQVNLAGGNLTGANLTGAILNRANLSGAILTGANLTNADLTGATLTNATLDHVTAQNANLWNAKATSTSMVGIALGGASLRGADLTGADLTDASMWDIDLDGAKLAGATLSGVSAGLVTGTPTSLPAPWKLIKGYLLGPKANLRDADLSDADLTNVDLTDADLSSTWMQRTVLTNATLTGANISDADLTSATLTDANMVNADLSDSVFISASVQGLKLAGATLAGVSSGGIGGNPASLPAPWIIVAGYLMGPGANLRGAVLTGVSLVSVDLTGADLGGVRSGGITGSPTALPVPWKLISGYLIGPEADLHLANLSGLTLAGVDLTGANLSDVVMTSGALVDSTLTNTDLSGANLFPDDMQGITSGGIVGTPTRLRWHRLVAGYLFGPRANLSDRNLSGQTWNLGTAECTFCDLSGTDLSGARLEGKFAGSTFADADVTGAWLEGATLWEYGGGGPRSGGIVGSPASLPPDYSLRNGYLVGPSASLDDANFDGAYLVGITAARASLKRANLHQANLTGGDLTLANLTSAVLTGANLSGADLSFATLTGVVSGGIVGQPTFLPYGWVLVNGFLLYQGVLPGAPTIGVATAGDQQATVTWSAPASTGDSGITGYVVTPYIGAAAQTPIVVSSPATTKVVTDLTNGTAYTFKVAATNGAGTGPQSAASNPVTPAPALKGLLRVVTSPALPSQITVDGVIGDTWALRWVKTPVGSHTVCFSQVPGFTTPSCQTVTVAVDATTTVTGSFVPRGYLRVTTSPSVPSQIKVDGIARNSYGMWTDLATGSHQVCFGAVAGFTAPACQTVTVTAGTTTTANGTFVTSSAAGQTGVGFLRAVTSPAVPSQITVDGAITDSWGLTWMEIAPGSHTVCFSHVENYTEPACQTTTVTAGVTATVTGTFARRGFLKVDTSPAVAATVTINSIPADDWGVYTDLPPGTYHVCFGAAPGKTAPPCQDPVVAEGTLTAITGLYT